MIKLSATKLAFQPCCPGESVYQTVQLTNTSDTPVLFKALQDSTQTFKAYPSLGLVPGKSFALLTFEFSPKSPRFYNFASQLLFNNSTANIQSVGLQGYSYAPAVSFAQEKLFFPPCYVGVSTRQVFAVQNDARIPCEFEWKVAEKYKNEITFTPQRSLLAPNESLNVVASFTPLKKKEYQISVPLYVKNLFDQAKSLVGYFNPGSGAHIVDQNTRSVSQMN